MNSDEINLKLRDIHPYDEKFKLHHMAANEIDRLLAESQSRLDGLLSATEANRVSLAKLSQAEKQRDEFLDALCKLCYAAETSGGTAGKDEYLCAAIKSAKDTIATGIINNIFLRQEFKNNSQSCGECHLKSNEICDICGVKEE